MRSVLTCLVVLSVIGCADDATGSGGGSTSSSSKAASVTTGGFMTGSAGTQMGTGGCSPEVVGMVRDFRSVGQPMGHPDFGTFAGGTVDLVQEALGFDHKPSYAPNGPTPVTSGANNFGEWFRNVSGVNQASLYTLDGAYDPSTNVFRFSGPEFFPIDGKAFGNEGQAHNFSFTFELHLQFVYRGGESLTMSSGDDLWVFVNGHLVNELDGMKLQAADFDARAAALGLVVGQTYPYDVFFAERDGVSSELLLEATLEIVSCGPLIY